MPFGLIFTYFGGSGFLGFILGYYIVGDSPELKQKLGSPVVGGIIGLGLLWVLTILALSLFSS